MRCLAGDISGVQFPKAFTEIPDVSVVEKTQIGKITFVRTNSSASANVKFNYIAIGKWK